MKRLLSVTSLVLFASLSAVAQEYPKAEVFGGYSFFRAEGGTNLNGWNASVNGNLNSWFGLVADFSGHYDSSSSRSELSLPGFPGFPGLPPVLTVFDAETSIHNFLAGPRFSYRKNQRITPFAHVLLGASRRHIESEVTVGVLGRTFLSGNNTAFAAALGGGLDVELSKNIALRVVQADYVLTRSFGSNGNNARVSAGIVFRFGNK
ncbi:MAG: outer membrane beta-barrel protein [Blastocatellia bacterium]